MVLIYQRVRDFLLTKKESLLWLTIVVVILITLQQYFGGEKRFGDLPYTYTNYNNYLIFKYSFLHFFNGLDLYERYPAEHWDLYKYSPTFAMVFGVLVWLPDWLGLFIWNLVNALTLWIGVRFLPNLDDKKKNLLYLILFVELITSLQNSQSNALIAGLIILAFGLMERNYFFWACLCIALTVYIKLFGLFAFAICLLYPQRWKMVVYSAVWMIVLWILPAFVIGIDGLLDQYKNWYRLLQQDYIPNPLSLVGALDIWFGLKVNSNVVLAIGLLLFALPLMKWKLYSNEVFRLLFLSMIFVWMVIFNHKAESPTFIIAMAGVAMGYISLAEKSRSVIWLTWIAVIFTSLSTTDIFPQIIQREIFIPYAIKVLPCLIFYFFVFFKLLTYSSDESMRFSGPGRSD
jgi:hypothetical protein